MADRSVSKLVTSILTRAQLDDMVDWAANVGWNPGVYDAEPFFQADPEGYHGVFDDKGMAGCFSLVRYGGDAAFGGFYIIRTDLRGHGLGGRLLEEIMDLASPYNFGIDGVLDMVPKYQRMGFRPSHENIRFRTIGGGEGARGLVDLRTVDREKLVRYDAKHFLSRRERFLISFMSQPGTIGLGRIDGSKIMGFGIIRRCRVGWKIGPLFADDEGTALDILDGLLLHASGEEVFWDLPVPNRAAMAMADRKGMVPVFRTVRMYTKHIPELPLHNIYGITTFELG